MLEEQIPEASRLGLRGGLEGHGAVVGCVGGNDAGCLGHVIARQVDLAHFPQTVTQKRDTKLVSFTFTCFNI